MSDTAQSHADDSLIEDVYNESSIQLLKHLYRRLAGRGQQINISDVWEALFEREDLFEKSVFMLHRNVQKSAMLLGVTEQVFVAPALLWPHLIRANPDALNSNVEHSAKLLGITKSSFVGLGLKVPQLFTTISRTLKANVECSARLLGVSTQAFVAAGTLRPQLFLQKPDTLNSFAVRGGIVLDLPKRTFVSMLMKRPQLLSHRIGHLNNNAEKSAELLGMSKPVFVGMAAFQPKLLSIKPETLRSRWIYLHKIRDALENPRGLKCFETNWLAYRNSRLHVCYILAKLGIVSGSIASVLQIPPDDAEQLLTRHYTQQIARSGKGGRALQALHATGALSNLPPGISAISRPVRKRTPRPRYRHPQLG